MSEIKLSRLIPGSIEEVFAAWIDPALRARWSATDGISNVRVEQDVRVGGAYAMRMDSTLWGEIVLAGRYLEVEPPSRLVFSWWWEVHPELSAHPPTEVTLQLQAESAASTRVTLRHTGFVDVTVAERHGAGWLTHVFEPWQSHFARNRIGSSVQS